MDDMQEDKVVKLDSKYYHVTSMGRNSAFENKGEVVLSEVDADKKENGLYVHSWHDDYGEKYVEVGTKKDGNIVGSTYLFINDKLHQVKLEDNTYIGSKDVGFKAYEKTAPDVKAASDILRKAEVKMHNEVHDMRAEYTMHNNLLFDI
jgi:hypothetical protein